MKDHKKTKALLEQALKSIPMDFALSSARTHIVAALKTINEVERRKLRLEDEHVLAEKKRKERENAIAQGLPRNELWKIDTRLAREALQNVNKMIDAELDKIKSNVEDGKPTSNDNDISTIYN